MRGSGCVVGGRVGFYNMFHFCVFFLGSSSSIYQLIQLVNQRGAKEINYFIYCINLERNTHHSSIHNAPF